MTDSAELVRQLVALPGPPGEERAVAVWLSDYLLRIGCTPEIDAKGNVLVRLEGAPDNAKSPSSSSPLSSSDLNPALPDILVTAHMDEIALIVTKIEEDGKIRVAASGGVFTWKWGEGPVDILTREEALTGILSYGCIHTNDEKSVVEYARHHPLDWGRAFVFTGLDRAELTAKGVRPGIRVVIAPPRRNLTEFGPYLSGYFLDDRADLAAMLLAVETLTKPEGDQNTNEISPAPRYRSLTFAATASEEVGGEGALFIMNRQPIDICIALEIGPRTPEADFPIDAQPTIWVRDGYAAMDSRDGDLLTDCCRALGQTPHWQYLSRGGSDASCAAAKGLCARPVTLGFPVENSHGYEIMHRDAPNELARLLLQYLKSV